MKVATQLKLSNFRNLKSFPIKSSAVQQGSLDIVQLLVTLGANVQFPIQGERCVSSHLNSVGDVG